jgi:hypothetical protein
MLRDGGWMTGAAPLDRSGEGLGKGVEERLLEGFPPDRASRKEAGLINDQ